MPPGKTRRKDDTWTTEDLTEALKGPRGDLDKKKRSREDDDKKERRRHRDEVNGDDSRRRHKEDERRSHKEEGHRGHGRSRGDFSPERRVELTEEDRDRLRQERREKRGGESKKKEDRVRRDEKPVDSEDDARRRNKREESARRHRKRDDEDDGDRRRRHGDDDGDRKRHREKESRHKDDEDDDDERERRRQERRERREKRDEDGTKDRDHKSKRTKDEDEDRKERHRDREDRHRDREDRHKDRDREERRKDRDDREDRKHKDRGDRDDRDERKKRDRDRDRDKETREERDERKRRERDAREREKEEQRRKEEEERRRKEEEEKRNQDGDDDAYDDDDFEDYEDDFEDDDEMNESGRPKKKEGEMEEVLRALDEENARLTSLSNRSNWSDSTELSDERFKEGEEGRAVQTQQGGDGAARPRTFINFVSAKQRVLNQSVASKARRRANDLKNMIELDTAYYDMFDLPPVREYELYIRSFGRSNTKQAYVQTNEDAAEREIQTEEIDDLDKWTQHPAEDLAGVGGDGITVMTGSEEKAVTKENMARVGKFIERAAQVINVLLEEEKGGEEGGGETRERTSNMSLSEGFSQLGCPSFLSGRYIEKVSFCPMQPNTFLTLHSKPQQPSAENPIDGYGLICVWSVKEIASPQKILTCLSQPTCACFSPSRAALVIAGMHDGSVMLWDLREPSSLHRGVYLNDQEIVTRFPTYNTAGVLEKENHHSPVMAITAVHPTVLKKDSDDVTTAESEGGLSFQLASVEERATVNLWVVTEIPAPDMAGSEVDLGLAPGGRVKLLRSSAIPLDNPNKLSSSGTSRALDIQLNPSDLNHFFVATDLGQIIHGVRFGSRVFPRLYQPEIESPKRVTCLDFSPFGKPYFLTGSEDGSVCLYHTSLRHPLSTWSTFCEGQPIVTVQWSRSRPVVFFVLAANSTVYTFDLVQTGLIPVQADAVTSGRLTAMAVASDPALIGGNKALPTHMLFAMDNGSAELHTIGSELRQQQPLEIEFLGHYMERF